MDQPQVFIQMALKAWETQIGRATKFFDALSDESLWREIAPGKNRIIYLLGHLIAVNDSMISLFGLGERSYAHFDEPFLKNADNINSIYPTVSQLRNDWKASNEALAAHFARLSPQDWFGRHAAMTDEDLTKEPTRNKLSVLINRTNHVAYHLGQLVLVKESNPV
jgi:hypothetical protein